MAVEQYYNIDESKFHKSDAYWERPRLRKLLEKAMDYPMLAVCAGAGYGKTRTIHSFFQEYPAHLTWLQVSGRDNVETRFWENFAYIVSLSRPEAGARLLNIGFPETDDKFAEFEALIRQAALLPGKFVTVLDDFHLLQNTAILSFLRKTVSILPKNASVVIISRTVPDIDMIGMLLQERIFMIHEDTLCFTEDEIAEYFNRLELPATRQEIRDIYDDTHGWAFAINLIGRSLRDNAKYKRSALEAVKTNIFKFIETEISKTISETLWRFLLRISLIDHLASDLINELASDIKLVKEMELLNAYIRYDYHLNAYMIHHLFLEYLRRNQHILTDEEKRETYEMAGTWCEKNNYQTDALSYYEKSGNYDAIMHIVYSFNMQMPQDIARYTLDIFERMPESITSQNPMFPAISIKLKMSLGQLDEAAAMAKQYAEYYEARPETPERNHVLAGIYGAWGLLSMYTCHDTDKYDFYAYYEKQDMYHKKSPHTKPAFSTGRPAGAWALLIGTSRAGAPEEYIEAVAKAMPYISRAQNGNAHGFDDLARGELCYFRWELDDAEQYLKRALDKAQENNQHDIQNGALFYLMRIALYRGDLAAADRLLHTIKDFLNESDYAIRYTAHDIACGLYYITLEHLEAVPEWLKGEFGSYRHPALLENTTNYIKARYHYHKRKYGDLLAFIEKEQDQQKILFGKIELKLIKALSLYRLKRKQDALDALTESYDLAAPNGIITPFIQYAKDMRTLTSAALRDDACLIPRQWLENINRKASAYAKRQAHMISKYKSDNLLEDGITLTKRELEVLKDLTHGLSRSEIAASQNISTNTVKMIINIIYDKLCVSSLADAIRVAVENKIV